MDPVDPDYTSVDEFVAAYLDNLPHPSAAGVNGLLGDAAGLQPAYQQPAGFPTSQQAPGPTQQGPQVARWDPHQHIAVPQIARDMCMQQPPQHMQQQFMPAADWQMQQQEQLQQQQQQLELWQHHQQQQLAADMQAANATSAGHAERRQASAQQQQQQQPAASSSAATSKRRSSSRGSARSKGGGGRPPKLEVQPMDTAAEADANLLNPDLFHSWSAGPVLAGSTSATGAVAAAAMAAADAQRSLSANFPTGFGVAQDLTGVLMMQQTQAVQERAAAAGQAAPAGAGLTLAAEADEPDMSHMTVMQRYHARRKLAMQRMEREVEEKIAQLALLEQENRQLKWQTHILENMLLDMDKQVELMSSEELPDASQWLTLLGMGANAAAGGMGRVARTLHKMLEGASTTDITGWTVQDCRRKWLAYLSQVLPLVEEAEAAQAAYRAAQATSSEQQSGAAQQQRRRPQRAAAAAAAAVIKQEVAEVLGVQVPAAPAVSTVPQVPLPQGVAAAAAAGAAAAGAAAAAHPGSSHSSCHKSPSRSPSVAAAGAADASTAAAAAGDSAVQPMEGIQLPPAAAGVKSTTTDPAAGAAAAAAAAAAASLHPTPSEHSVSSVSGSEVSHGPNIEGVPAALLAKIEDLVMFNFFWLLAIMTRNPVLTYEFISSDLVEGRSPLPPQQDELWGEVATRLELTLEQQQECCTCLQVARRCMAKVIEERAEITATMHPAVDSPATNAQSQAWLSYAMLGQNQADISVERMRANVRKESVVRNLVGFYCINVLSVYQLAKLSVAPSPYFCMAWRVIGAVEEQLAQRLAGESAADGQQQQQQQSVHNTRSSARLAAAAAAAQR